jgi:hypothetical protein
MRFDEILGKKITLSLVSSETHYIVTLRGAEEGGIWIESREMDAMIGHKPVRVSKSAKPPTRPTIFIPYSQIALAVYDSVDLGE